MKPMRSLFDDPLPAEGLDLVPNFVQHPTELLHTIDTQSWITDLTRRMQHYGWRYDYRSRAVDQHAYLGPLPEFLQVLAVRLHDEGLMASIPDQAIVNEYLPGQGIAAHIDCEPCFGPQLATLSLGDDYPMRFTHVASGDAFEIWLPQRSVCIMSGPARNEWRHEIAKRKSDALSGARKQRKRRVAVTFRTVTRVRGT